ncbi:recombinase family protein [Methylocystis sp.]|uniref:recombinase family protein n=1 Tax=Methylocystis sp. TaxID=1911079 RepID=UPI003DA3E4AB
MNKAGGTSSRNPVTRVKKSRYTFLKSLLTAYKVDRLTRSHADFAKIVDVLDAHKASVVSVMQQLYDRDRLKAEFGAELWKFLAEDAVFREPVSPPPSLAQE